jgi:hypothetical protein
VAAGVVGFFRARAAIQEGEGEAALVAVAESLLAMREADQRVRNLYLGSLDDGQPRTEERQVALDAERLRLDREHVARLEDILAQLGGWPRISVVGEAASGAACIIAVHAVQDPAFMGRAAALMEPLVRQGEAEVNCWAMVTDRVLRQQGKPQRYGTQFRMAWDGDDFLWGIETLEDPSTLLQRRAELGLMDYADYLWDQRRIYRIPRDAKPFPDEPVIPGLIQHPPPEPPPPVREADPARSEAG